MHKATFLEGTINLTIAPDGPILIKAGESGGADPTLPDMEFVRSQSRIYLPGPSLKGVVRAQCERICRSLDGPTRYDLARQRRGDDEFIPPLADNPLVERKRYKPYTRGGDEMRFSSGIYFEELRSNSNAAGDTALIYRRSSLVSQIFGHTSLAGRVRFADAYPTGEVLIEERNGVAIDRIYGSVAVGPFNYETVVGGAFATRIDFKNLTLAQLALLGLALRDLAEGRVGIGFGKSRGLGRVKITFDSLRIFYPTCELASGALRLLDGREAAPAGKLAGLGALCADGRYQGYALPPREVDLADLPEGLACQPDEIMGVSLTATGDEQVRAIWKACMPAWRWEVGL
ncbi:MAG: RAMP superfamily CRISPR-associated protein [Chloroflexaceae bacterium]|nr:RAMP superfamily CRISPR-associated protein [Chloroflexaceae bacterium]